MPALVLTSCKIVHKERVFHRQEKHWFDSNLRHVPHVRLQAKCLYMVCRHNVGVLSINGGHAAARRSWQKSLRFGGSTSSLIIVPVKNIYHKYHGIVLGFWSVYCLHMKIEYYACARRRQRCGILLITWFVLKLRFKWPKLEKQSFVTWVKR